MFFPLFVCVRSLVLRDIISSRWFYYWQVLCSQTNIRTRRNTRCDLFIIASRYLINVEWIWLTNWTTRWATIAEFSSLHIGRCERRTIILVACGFSKINLNGSWFKFLPVCGVSQNSTWSRVQVLRWTSLLLWLCPRKSLFVHGRMNWGAKWLIIVGNECFL